MATTVVLKSRTNDPVTGRVYIQFSDGSGREYANLSDLRDQVLARDLDMELTKDLCIAYAIARSADLSNIAMVKDKNFTFDMSVTSCIKVQ